MTLSPSPKSPPRQRDPFERDRARMNRYRELRDFYDGTQWLGKARRGEKRLVVNYARALVRKVVSYALPDPVGFEVPAPVLTDEGERSRSREVEMDGLDSRLPDSSTPRLLDSKLPPIWYGPERRRGRRRRIGWRR